MSGRGGHVDKHIAKATAFKLHCQRASIPEAMRASTFSLAKSSNPAKQMAVRRAYEKAIGGKTKAAPAIVLLLTVLLLSTTSSSSLSPMTEPLRTKSTAKCVGMQTPEHEIQAKPKARQIQHTVTGMQKWQVNKFNLSEHSKRAFKRAMSWYDQDQQTATEVKALAILDAKASFFEENDYKGVSVSELTVLLAWYNNPKEKTNSTSTMFRRLYLRSGGIWMRRNLFGSNRRRWI